MEQQYRAMEHQNGTEHTVSPTSTYNTNTYNGTEHTVSPTSTYNTNTYII